MIKILKNVTENPILLSDVGKTISSGQEFNTEGRQDTFINSNNTLTAIRNGSLQVGDGSKFYTNALEGEAYFRTRFDDNAFLIDGSNIIEFTPEIVTDEPTGKKATNLFMDILTMLKEFYNDPGDPLYEEGFQPLLGENGREEEHLSRTLNLEDIHAKHGWHREEIRSGTWQKPLDLLIYYGWLNSFNSSINGWNNEKVAQDFAKYGILVFGDGLQNPSHGDYTNTQIIIPRIKALNPFIKIYGYVSCNQSYANFTPKVDQWNNLYVDGIFIDSAGYDYGTVETNGREALNAKIDYVHGKTYSNNVFVNAWNMDHIIGTVNDPTYPNSTWNPSLVESKLTYNDWYLLESFPINTSAFSGTGGYEDKAEWASRGVKAINHRNTYGINLGGVAVIGDANTNAIKLFNFSFVSSLMFCLETFGSSDENFGASSATTTYRSRPNTSGCGRIYQVAPGIQNDINDSDVYIRYSDYAKFLLDFSTGAQFSSITKTDIPLKYSISFLAGTITLTNMPLANTELPAANWRLLLDLSAFTQFRVTMRVATAGSANSDLRFQYATTDGGAYANLDGIDGPEIAIDSTGEKDSGWVNLAIEARTNNIRIRMMGKDGNGTADPVVRQITLHFR